ncbi:MAG: hypothetical protein AABZ60_17075 [Planctomycetota bacterium]
MWIVKNLLRGTLKFSGLGVEIPPRQEFDLDTIGREITERSNQLIVAFEEGYLQNIRKGESDVPVANITIGSAGSTDNLSDSLSFFKNDILNTLQHSFPELITEGMLVHMKDSIVGDLGEKLDQLKRKIQMARQNVLDSRDLSDAEIQARLLFLAEQENSLERHLHDVGTKTLTTTKESDLQAQANQLDGLLEE